jgi:hypothetical protein
VPHEARVLAPLGVGDEVVERHVEQQALRLSRETDGGGRCVTVQEISKRCMEWLAAVVQGKSNCKGRMEFGGNVTVDN